MTTTKEAGVSLGNWRVLHLIITACYKTNDIALAVLFFQQVLAHLPNLCVPNLHLVPFQGVRSGPGTLHLGVEEG